MTETIVVAVATYSRRLENTVKGQLAIMFLLLSTRLETEAEIISRLRRDTPGE